MLVAQVGATDLAVADEGGSDKAFAVETRGIETVPHNERHGSPRDLFWVWAGANTQILYPIVGGILVGLGLGFWPAVLAIVIGNFCFILVGIGGTSGPKAGTSTLVISRSAFGRIGNAPYAFFSWLTTVGWEAVFIIIGTTALYGLALELSLPAGAGLKAICLAVVVSGTVLIARLGHATIVVMQRILGILLAVGMVVLAVYVLPKTSFGHGFNFPGPLAANSRFWTWVLALSIMVASAPMSWVNCPADYSRYLPSDTSSRAIVLWTTLGCYVPGVALAILGAAVATVTGMSDIISAFRVVIAGWFTIPFLLVVVGGTVTNNFLNTYSSGMSMLAFGVPIRRHNAVVIDMTIASLIAIYGLFVSSFLQTFENFLALMIAWLAPWAGIFLANMLLRRNRYDVEALHQRGGGSYWYTHGWSLQALAVFLVGAGCTLLFTNATIYRGPAVDLIGGSDISVFVGFACGFLGYLAVILITRGRPAKEAYALPSRS